MTAYDLFLVIVLSSSSPGKPNVTFFYPPEITLGAAGDHEVQNNNVNSIDSLSRT